ncbi:hypothetical protein RVBP17_1910 [Pseudomonas phage sp. 30-3]|uniref:Uncharacterized protein n=1 Tax=Pseudomonas phage vB_PaeM_PA5oct TaxID=2163605 RepID=A0A4Y1LUT5_9CAUD|nr:hypothetical protein PQE65_gp204 [Pseudomonas phage vB_PaeM_PA5oct]WMI31825.1 hypothetical protein GBBBJNDB_00122 [Pseudomonas phage Callisto]WPK38755.1 hypothetical protein Cassandra_0079 [Pseudomonas phage Cassandra]WPK39276.1 hypothetical protein Deiofobo_0079 [Pseudomonas phage Deifobo]WPK40309.1 hypothetical protein Paride_0079 [Pseudomonas phage Paride]VOH54257.1 hypothetical protein MIJ3_00122 [Pseudomonas phage vB_PaeM_MIJ3]BDR25766.1 hypothetical protein RVBP16_2060 [Pseudomonas p
MSTNSNAKDVKFEIDFDDVEQFNKFVSFMNSQFGHGRKNWSAGSPRYSIKRILSQRSARFVRTKKPFPVRVYNTDMDAEHILVLIKLCL